MTGISKYYFVFQRKGGWCEPQTHDIEPAPRVPRDKNPRRYPR